MKNFDHIIVGSGQATGTLLGRLIPTGDSIAVIEGGKVGGSCVNYGCTPTKTLVASARAVHIAGRGEEFGFSTGAIKVEYGRVRERMDAIRNDASNGLTRWMETTENVTLLRDWGAFKSDRILEVGDSLIEGENVYINVGGRPHAPPIDGLDTVPWLDSARLLDLEVPPHHLVIVGGGYIAVEFGQIFRRFGSEVTIVQNGDQLMTREDEDVAASVLELLEKEGVRVIMGARVSRVTRTQSGIQIAAVRDGGTLEIGGSHLLVAAGRRSNADRLNIEATSIETDARGFIQVDDFCRTGADGVFAVGDVNGRGAFTHTSVNDAEIVLDHLFGGPRRLSSRIPIYALFCDPPLGRVGMTEKEALASGRAVLKATRPMNLINRAKEMSETHGFAKLLVDGETDLILGASILGPGGDEIINMFAAIMHSGIPCKHYRQVVLVHPTVSELMPWILDRIAEVRQTS